MKLWLDDVRKAPEGWHWVLTAEEAIEWLKRECVTEMSLDHDLGDGQKPGSMVLDWLEEKQDFMSDKGGFTIPLDIHVHSMNPVGAPKMRELANRILHRAWVDVARDLATGDF